jgi:hypothetical protein
MERSKYTLMTRHGSTCTFTTTLRTRFPCAVIRLLKRRANPFQGDFTFLSGDLGMFGEHKLHFAREFARSS